jgi:hypothetical protein
MVISAMMALVQFAKQKMVEVDLVCMIYDQLINWKRRRTAGSA